MASIAGPRFRSGSFEFTYEGRLLEMGGGLRIVNAEKSLIFDEQMLEPGMKFPSPRLEAVYGLPFDSASVSVIVTNTTSQLLVVRGEATFAGSIIRFPVISILKPRETDVVVLPRGLVKKASAGAVSLNHNGDKGALLAMIHLEDADRGYSGSVNFTNPGGKTTERHGAGLQLGSINNDPLKPVIAIRNIGDSATTVTATVPYSRKNGDTGTIPLPQVSLAPGEIKLLNTSNPQLRRNDFATAGLEIKYTGAPGSVIASASSVSQSGNHVFALPVKDPQGGLSSTGGYPWFINGSSSTVVFIKNTTNEPQQFHLDIVYPGGRWGSNLKTLAPGQTTAFDVRKIRDAQEVGSGGNTMPPDASTGHIAWKLRGARDKVLIGRAQTVDMVNGLASTYECQCPCGGGFHSSRFLPGNISGEPGDTTQCTAQERDMTCFGFPMEWYDIPAGNVSFSVDNTNVATIGPDGVGVALAPGTTILRASFNTAGIWYLNPYEGGCALQPLTTEATGFCEVALPAISISEITIDDSQIGVNETTTLRATIASGAGATGQMGTVYFYRSRGATAVSISPASRPIMYGTTQTFTAIISRLGEGSLGDTYFKVEADGDSTKVRFVDNPKESPKLVLK